MCKYQQMVFDDECQKTSHMHLVMLKRTITAMLGILVLIPSCIFSGTGFFIVIVAAFTLIGVYEMIRCIGAQKKYPLVIPIYILAVAAPVSVRVFQNSSEFVVAYSSTLFILLLYFFGASVFQRGRYRIEQVTMTFVLSIYIITSFLSIILLRDMPNGKYIYLLAVIGPWISDIFAYLVGTLFGKHKLIPEVSPKKTVEGSIGGVIFCGIFFVLYGFITSLIYKTDPEYIALLLAGILVSIISQMGDLTASLIKRQYNIKDYGKLFPGHGGVIDRFDSILSTAPFLLIICSASGVFTLFI